jgi:hypothetical protein
MLVGEEHGTGGVVHSVGHEADAEFGVRSRLQPGHPNGRTQGHAPRNLDDEALPVGDGDDAGRGRNSSAADSDSDSASSGFRVP